ncbi:type III-B CRISPR-associated protein Cas10/Cmr2 [Haliangium sp.]|uniref:type III-B CRISPR-associated protein Cas10/Cmr2 n=1 Tax=Haliangium sp. TaxID=2663208 RepID=UPI003D0B32E8
MNTHAHVLIVALGPVQDFIAQARRTRDLWFGSHVLSEVSKAAAKALAEIDGVTLIFPALDRGDPALEPTENVRRAHGEMPYSVANKLVAELAAEADPANAAVTARDAARRHLLDWGREELKQQRALVDEAASAVADEQLAGLLEIRAVWAPIGEDGYAGARAQAERELAARKTLHAFAPWSRQRGGVLKSSLDGARETVLRRGPRTDKAWGRYRIGLREELDAVGVLKRTGGNTVQFVPIPTVGMAAWIERAATEAPHALQALREGCEEQAFQRVAPQRPWLESFRYDAQVLLPERWEPYLRDHRSPANEHERRRVRDEAAKFGRQYVTPLLEELLEPSPYVACLVADGDHMGRAIEALANAGAERHRELSRALARFAGAALRVVERDHRGVLVYAGGDDVLAFVCVQDALACAARLRECFAEEVAPVVADAAPAPTLSVGLGIGHVMQSLGHLLALGRRAENMAKRGDPATSSAPRDALAVVFERHTGATREWRCRWPDGPIERLRQDVALVAGGRLSTSKIHEIERLLARAITTTANDDKADGGIVTAADGVVLAGEVRRVLARTEAEVLTPEQVGLVLVHPADAKVGDGVVGRAVGRWIRRMHIAVALGRANTAAPLTWPRGDA